MTGGADIYALMRKLPPLGAVLVIGLGLAGCNDSLDENDDYNSVITLREPGKDFTAYATFAMQEVVVDLSSRSDDPIELDHSIDDEILNAVAKQMAAKGYDRITDATAADVHVVVGAVASNNWSWYGYYPWYGYGYDSYYWYYPPVAVPVNTPTGSVIVLMIDANEAEQGDGGITLAPVVWAASARGLLSSTSANATRAINLIDQMFDQSPYLKVGEPVDAKPGIGADGGADLSNDDGGVL